MGALGVEVRRERNADDADAWRERHDVPIAEAEQYFVALKDVGVETVFVRYPREGHGIRESKHVVDSINRSIAWYEKHFPTTPPESLNPAVP